MRLIMYCAAAAMIMASCQPIDQVETEDTDAPVMAKAMETKTVLEYGFDTQLFEVEHGTVRPNQTLSVILQDKNVPLTLIQTLVDQTREVFDVRHMRVGKDYAILTPKNEVDSSAQYFVYENDQVNYTVFSLADSLHAYTEQKPVEIQVREASGEVTSSLYKAMLDNDLSPTLSMELAEMYAWTIDFYRIQKGDFFKVIFEERMVDGESVGVGNIIAANFHHANEDNYGFFFDQAGKEDYFDTDGESLRKAFLKSPVKFSRLSSRYNKKRFHPVLKRVKPHLGTDYAAPHGTPILAVGDGVVIKSSYTKGNGKYVKIRHNGTFETQYLHMSKRAVKVGDKVYQGNTIGYVGSTGLATGPHVCFRFWKNGTQVDHLKEKFPSADPIKPEFLTEFTTKRVELQARLDAIELGAPIQPENDNLMASKTP